MDKYPFFTHNKKEKTKNSMWITSNRVSNNVEICQKNGEFVIETNILLIILKVFHKDTK